MFEKTLIMTLSGGIKLYTTSLTSALERWAKNHWGVDGIRCFLSEDKDGVKNYIIVNGECPIYEHQNFESLCVWFDVWALANGYSQKTGWSTFGK